MRTLCITTAADTCGRAILDSAIAHAHDRAAALGVRQQVLVQRDAQTGAGTYFRIRSVR